MDEKEKRENKFAALSEHIKTHKKRVIIVSAIAAAIILLIIVLLIILLTPPKEKQTVGQNISSEMQEIIESGSEVSSVQASSSTSSAPISSATPSSKKSTTTPSVNITGTSAQKTGYQPLDTLISGILSKITNSGMSSNAKLNAIYNYVKSKMKYNMLAPATNGLYEKLMALGYSDYDSRQMTLAFNAATYYQGVCDDYAALTMVLARAAGIPLYQSGGLSSGGSSHAWDILMVNGEKYLVDTNYGIFMKRFSQSGFTEQMDGRNYFNNFKTTVKAEEKKISWMFNAGFGNQRFLGNSRGEITQKAEIKRPMYADGALYPTPISPLLKVEGANNTFSATVKSNGAVIETLKNQSGAEQSYYFSWYPPREGSYVIEITATGDGIFTGHYIINADITK